MTAPARFVASLHQSVGEVAEAWRELETGGHLTAFQRLDWCRPWYAVTTAHRRAETFIILVRDARDSGRPVMLLPLCRIRKGWLRVVGFADLRVTDYVAPVVSGDARFGPADHDAMLAAALDALPDCDVVRLAKMPARVGGIDNPLMRLAGVRRFPVSAWAAALADGGGLRPGGQARRKWMRAERTLAPRLMAGGRDVPVETVFATLVEQRRARFGALGRRDVLADPVWRDFYQRVSAGCGGPAAAELTQLELGGEVAATALGIDFGGAYHVIIPTFRTDGAWGRVSPGLCLLAALLRRSATRGDSLFDLTIGDEPYKREFDVVEQPLHELTLARSPLGRVAAALWRLNVTARRFPRLHGLLKRLAGRG